jgi:ATP-dependent DNA ligase
MQSFIHALKTAEAASGAGSDQVKQEAIALLSDDGKRLMFEMFSIFRTFGVKQYDMPEVFADVDAPAHIFFTLLNQLQSRALTGNAARAAVTGTFSKYTEETVKYLARVLDKDAKAGFSESTVNKVFPGLIPVFKAMKGEKIEDKKKKNKDGSTSIIPFDFEKNVGLPARIEIKHDGLRSIVFSGTPVMYFSYDGRPQEQWSGLFDDEINALAAAHGGAIVLDTEIEGDNFLETIRAKKSGNDLGKENLRLKAFDLLTREEWDAEKCTRPQDERSDYITELLEKVKPSKIVQTVFEICETIDQLKAFHAKACADGYEGTMLKRVKGMYEWKRSKNWWKWKPVITVDLKIVDFYEGKPGTKNEGTLGGLVLEGEDENKNKIRTNCGGFKVRGGLLDEWMKSIGIDIKNEKDIISKVRDYIWANRPAMLGMIAEIEGQELTLAEGETEWYSVRFPQFKMLRDDK